MSNVDTSRVLDGEFPDPTASSLKQLSSQLDLWREMLPQFLHWPEDDPTAFPIQDATAYDQALDPNLANALPAQHDTSLFTADLDREPMYYPFAYDIQVALLRTKYYHAKFVVHRPFVYKALHFPEQVTEEDAYGAADCLKVCYSFLYWRKLPFHIFWAIQC